MEIDRNEDRHRDPRVSVIYYSATGSIHALADAVREGAEKAGAEVRVRRVAELAPPEAIASNPQWDAHARAVADLPHATHDDLTWADAVVIGTPVRFGLPAAQVKQFLDSTGGLWAEGRLAGKVYAGFTSAATLHGGHESTLLALYNAFYHWGGFIVPPGYTAPIQFVTGNPYGASHVSDNGATPPGPADLEAASHLGGRVATVTRRLVTSA